MDYTTGAALEIAGETVDADASLPVRQGLRETLSAYVELTKPRITFLIALTAAAGFCLGAKGAFDYRLFFCALSGITLLSSGVAVLNQFIERDLDGLMRRTQARPLPSRRLAPANALGFGVVLTAAAEVFLATFVNPLSAALGLLVIVGYLGCYTPLKTRTPLSTAVGAVPGAMPPLIGWVAATNHIDTGAWVLFAILFLWQFPHFLAIAWMYREDYSRAGILMLPVVEPNGRRTVRQMIIAALLLVPVSILPSVAGTSGRVYVVGALLLGIGFLFSTLRTAMTLSRTEARRLLLVSVVYLPLLFALLVIDHA